MLAAGGRVCAHAKALHHAAQNIARAGVVVHNQHALTRHGGDEGLAHQRRVLDGEQRCGELEGAAHTWPAGDVDIAAHQLDQAVADGQAQARAAVAPGGLAVGLLKRAEDVFNLRFAQPDTRVSNAETNQCFCRWRALGAHVWFRIDSNHHFAVLGELDGIAHQVVEHLAQSHGVAAQLARHIGRYAVDHFQPFFFGAQRGHGRYRLQNIVQCKFHVF